jgi:hypothetical protein
MAHAVQMRSERGHIHVRFLYGVKWLSTDRLTIG